MASFGKAQIGTYTEKQFIKHQQDCDKAIANFEKILKDHQEKRKAYQAKIKELEALPARGKKQKELRDYRLRAAKRWTLVALNSEGKILGAYKENRLSYDFNVRKIWGKMDGYHFWEASLFSSYEFEYRLAEKLAKGEDEEDLGYKLIISLRESRKEIARYRLIDASAYHYHAIRRIREEIAELKERREKRTYEFIPVYL